MKHTPGPWSLEINSRGVVVGGGSEQYTAIFSESGFGLVAKVLYQKPEILGDSKKLAWETFEANARLIAAAPDLLEALQNIFVECGAVGSPSIGAMESAQRAIAKATQQTS